MSPSLLDSCTYLQTWTHDLLSAWLETKATPVYFIPPGCLWSEARVRFPMASASIPIMPVISHRLTPSSGPIQSISLPSSGAGLGHYSMDVYSLENATRSFFDSDISPSRKECDDLARSLLGGEPVVPSNIQGQSSYTVFSPQAVTEVRTRGDGSSHPAKNAKIV